MKIYSMTATFGKLENQTLALQPGLNIIQAPNEWGKTTWCAFLTAMFYGVDTRERSTPTVLAIKDHYAPWSGAPMAGRIDLCWKGRDITIERTSGKRIPLGEFKAYETASGVAIPELTADNCGKLLLGVEKSVFLRTGFVRLSDMPVTQDDALRRRLNELVTTGDESGQSDDLAQKLRDLKNKIRSNRSNGLIPQALAEKEELEFKLHQMYALQSQYQNLQHRQSELTQHIARLRNHQNTLAWEAAQCRLEECAEAKFQLNLASQQVAALEKTCAALPTEDILQTQLSRAKTLKEQKEDLQTQIAMLPPPPAAPQGLSPHDPVQAEKDYETYRELSAVAAPGKGLLLTAIAALIVALAGVVILGSTMNTGRLLPPIIGAVLFASFGWVAALCGRSYRNKNQAYAEALQQLQELAARYSPLPPAQWVSAAKNYVNLLTDYRSRLSAYDAHRTGLQQLLQQVVAELSALPNTDSHNAAIEKQRELVMAQKEQQHLMQLVQTLEAGDPLPEKPEMPDTLTCSESETLRLLAEADAESRQLHTRLGQIQGQMEALGSTKLLLEKQSALNDRLIRLKKTYAALELAQDTLVRASTELQRRFAPTITRSAKAYFAQLTGGRYDKLTLTQALTLETATTDEPATRKSQYRSDGTVDQLYLALRLAVADALIPTTPLVLDDALVRFDDTRLVAALALLRQMSQTRQVLLFSCQSREKKFEEETT